MQYLNLIFVTANLVLNFNTIDDVKAQNADDPPESLLEKRGFFRLVYFLNFFFSVTCAHEVIPNSTFCMQHYGILVARYPRPSTISHEDSSPCHCSLLKTVVNGLSLVYGIFCHMTDTYLFTDKSQNNYI